MEQERGADASGEEDHPGEPPQPPPQQPPKRGRGRPKKQQAAEPVEQDEAEEEVPSTRPPKRAATLRPGPQGTPPPSGSGAQPAQEVGAPTTTVPMVLFRQLLGDDHFLGPAFVTATLDFLRELLGTHQGEVHRRLSTWYPEIEPHLAKTRKHAERPSIRRSPSAFETDELQNFFETVTARGDEPFLFDYGTAQGQRAWVPNLGRLLADLRNSDDIVEALVEKMKACLRDETSHAGFVVAFFGVMSVLIIDEKNLFEQFFERLRERYKRLLDNRNRQRQASYPYKELVDFTQDPNLSDHSESEPESPASSSSASRSPSPKRAKRREVGESSASVQMRHAIGLDASTQTTEVQAPAIPQSSAPQKMAETSETCTQTMEVHAPAEPPPSGPPSSTTTCDTSPQTIEVQAQVASQSSGPPTTVARLE